MLLVVFVVYEVDLLSIGVEVPVGDIVEDKVNEWWEELLTEKLVVLLDVAVPLIDKLWLVDVDADSETVPDDVSDTLAVANTVPVWDALVVALRVDVIVGVLLSDKDVLLLIEWEALSVELREGDIDCDDVVVEVLEALSNVVCDTLAVKVSEALVSADEEIVSILVVVSSNVNDRVIAAVDDLDCDTL